MKTTAVKIENLSKKFGDLWALKDLSLDVKEGEMFGILGPNGAGKTTTIKLMAGLLRPTAGRVLIKGIDMQDNPYEAKRKFALLPDVPYLYEKLTGWEFMKFITRIYNIDKPDIDDRIDQQLKIFNIKEVAHDLIDSYSHGIRQRLLIASVMLRDPDIIMLDEPMVGLDPEAARMVKNIFKELIKKNKTIFLSTHTLTDAQELCREIAIINKGQLIAQGSIDDLKQIVCDIKKKNNDDTLTSDSLEEIYLSITRNA